MINLKHFMNVQAQEKAHLALLRMHYDNDVPHTDIKHASSTVHFCININALTAVEGGASHLSKIVPHSRTSDKDWNWPADWGTFNGVALG